MPWEADRFTPAAAQPKAIERDELAEDRERRHEARRFFRAAPPSCIEFDADGTAMLCQKVYEYWPNQEPEDATTWRVISRHQNLEEAECRMRLIIGGPVYSMPRPAWSARPHGASRAGTCRLTTTNSRAGCVDALRHARCRYRRDAFGTSSIAQSGGAPWLCSRCPAQR